LTARIHQPAPSSFPAHRVPLDASAHAAALLDVRAPVRPIDQKVVDRVRGEFTEMPGFSPTLAQATRLFALPSDDCSRVLAVLVREGFLKFGSDGQYRVVSAR
jgi:hypothetical protein